MLFVELQVSYLNELKIDLENKSRFSIESLSLHPCNNCITICLRNSIR